MKILDEIDVSEGRIKQVRLNIAIQEDRISDVCNARQLVLASQALLLILENDLAVYVKSHKKLLSIAVSEFRRQRFTDTIPRRPILH